MNTPTPPARTPKPGDPDYVGKTDYQGNHGLYEMPDEQKPTKLPSIPFNKICLIVIICGAATILILTFIEMMKQSGSFA